MPTAFKRTSTHIKVQDGKYFTPCCLTPNYLFTVQKERNGGSSRRCSGDGAVQKRGFILSSGKWKHFKASKTLLTLLFYQRWLLINSRRFCDARCVTTKQPAVEASLPKSYDLNACMLPTRGADISHLSFGKRQADTDSDKGLRSFTWCKQPSSYQGWSHHYWWMWVILRRLPLRSLSLSLFFFFFGPRAFEYCMLYPVLWSTVLFPGALYHAHRWG